MGNGKYRLIKQHNKRVSLRCPLSIPESSLNYSRSEGKYSIKFSLFNEGTGSLDNDTAMSAVVVLRCTDRSGAAVRFGESDYFARTINFGETGLPSGSGVSMAVTLGIPSGLQIVDHEVYISRIRFGSAEVQDYVRGDFFEMPGKPVPISSKYSSAYTDRIISDLGDQAIYMPEELSPIVWRCVCGEICDDMKCPTCGCGKDQVFLLFDAIGAKTKKAAPAPVAPAPGDDGSDGKKKKKPGAWLPIVIAALCLLIAAAAVILLFRSCSSGKQPEDTKPATTSSNITTSTEPPETSAKDIALAYVALHEFDNALSAAINGGCGSEVIRFILEEGVKYNVSIENYNKAYAYARQMSDTAFADGLVRAAYDEFLAADNYASALKAAEVLKDDELASAVAVKAVEALISEGSYTEAYNTAMTYGREELAKQASDAGIAAFLEALDYESALALAKLAGDAASVSAISAEATEYYIGLGDLDSASRFAAASADPTVLTELCEKLSDQALMRSFPFYFAYMKTSKKVELLSSTVSAGDYAAAITPEGKVVYGIGQEYTPTAGRSAVSVASSGRHTVILLSDGKAVAFGDNRYGQCEVSDWSDIVMISVGRYHTVGLTSSGKVVYTGRNNYGQISIGSVNNAAMISAGDFTTLVLRQDGTVTAYGRNTNGQCSVSSWTDVVYVSAGAVHSVGIKSDGSAVAAGSDLLGMSTLSSWSSLSRVYAGGSFTIGLDTDGGYLLAGSVIGGSLGSVDALNGASHVDAGGGYILAAFPDGRIEAFGSLAPDMTLFNSIVSPKPEDNGEE